MDRKSFVIVLALLLLAGVAGAGEIPIQDGIREGVSIGTIRPSGVTNTSVAEMFFRLHFAYIDYRHPWPVRWYDAAVKWLKVHLW